MMRILAGLAATLFLALPLRAEIAVEEVTSPGGIRAWLVSERRSPSSRWSCASAAARRWTRPAGGAR